MVTIHSCKLQAYILNIPIGQSITKTAKDVVTFGDFLWRLYEHNTRWNTWVNLVNIILILLAVLYYTYSHIILHFNTGCRNVVVWFADIVLRRGLGWVGLVIKVGGWAFGADMSNFLNHPFKNFPFSKTFLFFQNKLSCII